MNSSLVTAWDAVVAHPLFLVGLTLGIYQLGLALYERTQMALLHPLIVSIVLLIGALWLLGLEYPVYRDAVFPLTMLLGPATVALAVPLYHNLRRIRQFFWPVMTTLVVGGVFVTVVTLLLAWLLGADFAMLMTLAPKSLTTPIAMMVAEQLGGVAAMAAAFVMYTAVLGALMGPWLLSVTGVTHPAARGMALGLAAHAVGTSRALEEGEEAGAFAALAMSLMGIGTALLLPVCVTLWLLL
ncbi:TIGR00659 family protein [Halopseudomonas litoralis]|uniref:TIGR00659 family protein n=1 Tax=Halopseudomonas litoralis TaxID=797277 RepID=A0A1H1VBW1_9GAMM|nr:LrgB family protein [Halopseudomonas litoralis]SDS81886.1 TIGR00659 family protein [Halopseudomonas litoralis]